VVCGPRTPLPGLEKRALFHLARGSQQALEMRPPVPLGSRGTLAPPLPRSPLGSLGPLAPPSLGPLALTLVLGLALPPRDANAAGSSLTLVAVDSEPKDGLKKPGSTELAAMRHDVEEHPDDRTKRVALVRGLIAARDLDGALREAQAWRAKDAYNLVAVRALGDVHMERGEKEDAERVYSAIVELLPSDADAQRALATLLKQRGDLPAAKARLDAALHARPDDARLNFELADIELRLGKNDDALARLTKVIDTKGTSDQIRYPAKQRLGQLYGELRRSAKASGDEAKAKDLGIKLDALELKGGAENDVHVYLTWDTDRTDVDLWVTTPSGEKVFYSHRVGKNGESLFDDVTSGYGPESFSAKKAEPGEYKIEVNYFSARRGAFPEARGEVVVVLDEGRATEKKQVLPYRLFAEKQTVTVAKVRVGGGR
jgi:tetratricopeptide (TPR) repeat protein